MGLEWSRDGRGRECFGCVGLTVVVTDHEGKQEEHVLLAREEAEEHMKAWREFKLVSPLDLPNLNRRP